MKLSIIVPVYGVENTLSRCIDSILKHADIKFEDIEDFLARVDNISKTFGMDFIVSLSAVREELGPYLDKYEILN